MEELDLDLGIKRLCVKVIENRPEDQAAEVEDEINEAAEDGYYINAEISTPTRIIMQKHVIDEVDEEEGV